ncbi:flavin reductase family protein [Endozoicomonas sp. SCSIO W0465]|uniref:flavin reductase family protein n=1 Tax=Endozoicomonas sp. SCSIO W0465 TaxID=2918516 RepID=UPI002074B3CA|nr:flavin reductase family protein [Endozoicomonas sp. SCSIO W0465]USE35016.1 flavin reductase family protein [Endozoicomonas sp. SCSIO W0465]
MNNSKQCQGSLPEILKAKMLQSMRRLASSVTVISSANGEQRHAMAATAVTSLSVEPPSVLVCVNQSTAMHALLEEGVDFCVNVLSREQEQVSAMCGGRAQGEARFQTGNWTSSDEGLPYLSDAQSVLICEQDGKYSYGTHTIYK